jgi:hypothetical protein
VLRCRTDAFIGMKALEVILNMPVSLVEAAPVDTDFTAETIYARFLQWNLASSVIDVPFIFIFRIARLAVRRKSRFGSRLVRSCFTARLGGGESTLISAAFSDFDGLWPVVLEANAHDGDTCWHRLHICLAD